MRTLNRRQFLSFASTPGPSPTGYWIHVSREAMACRFEVTLPATEHGGIPAARRTLDEIERLEAQLTVYRDSSEVSYINRNAGETAVAVEPSLFELLLLSQQLHRETGGAFDITSSPLVRCWGFFQRAGRVPDPAELEVARRCVGMSQVLLNAADRTVRFVRPGVEINLGSIGKGYALDRVSANLRKRDVRTALLSGGSSSVVAVGGRDQGWAVGVRHPRKTGFRVATLRLQDAAMATSGAGEQYFVSEGKRYGHILDPRSGVPAGGVAGVTVVASSGAVADALATAFFVGGSELAEKYCANHPGVLALMVPEEPLGRPQVFGSHPGVVVESLSVE
jgi:thiamine biosynthesis lipoprotein